MQATHPLFFAPTLLAPLVSTRLSVGAKLKFYTRNDNHKRLIDQVDVWAGSTKTKPRIFCGIYTYEKNHYTKVKVSASIDPIDRNRVRLTSTCLYVM